MQNSNAVYCIKLKPTICVVPKVPAATLKQYMAQNTLKVIKKVK